VQSEARRQAAAGPDGTHTADDPNADAVEAAEGARAALEQMTSRLIDDVAGVREAGEAAKAAASANAAAFKRLLSADFAYAKAAAMRAAILFGLAALAAASAWLLALGLLLWALLQAELALGAALGLVLLAVILVGLVAALLARRHLSGARLDATRRFVARVRESGRSPADEAEAEAAARTAAGATAAAPGVPPEPAVAAAQPDQEQRRWE